MTLHEKKPLLIVVSLILIVVATVPSFYFYTKYQETLKKLTTTNKQADETAVLLTNVGKLFELPKDETPTIATISDKEKLKDQAFFEKAKNGDKILIYTKAKKAILYDPVANKIIDVAPVNIGSPSAQIQTEPIIVALYNGTNVTGQTQIMEKILKQADKTVTINAKKNAATSDYEKTIVIDVNGTKKADAERIAQLLHAAMSDIPANEAKPQADILIIIGQDFVTR